MGKLDNRVVIVTGAASGIGRATALAFAQEGCTVVATTQNNKDGLNSLVQEIKSMGGEASAIMQDVAEEADWDRVINKTIEAYGKINYLVNNAGRRHFGTIENSTYDEMMYAFKVDSMSVFMGMNKVIPYLRKVREANEGAAIVNVSTLISNAGVENYIKYVAAKSAVNAMTKCAAMDLKGTGIRVNVVLPGLIETPLSAQRPKHELESYIQQFAINRIGQPNEVASACVYLCLDESSYITATKLPIDGGYINCRIVK